MAVTVAGTPTVAETSSGTSVTCAVPAGVTAGELLVACATHLSRSSIPNQAGWTKAGQGVSPSYSLSTALFYRIATASEPASYTFTGLSSGANTVEMVRISGAPTSSVLDAAVDASGAGGTYTFTMPSLTTASAGALVLSAVACSAIVSSDIAAASGNPATIIADTTGTGRRTILAFEDRPAAGSVGTRAWKATANVAWAGISVAIKPATAASTSATVTGATATASGAAFAGSLIAGDIVSVTVNGATATASATSAAGTTVVPHLRLTATVEPGTRPPRIRLDVADDRHTPATQVTITRRDPDGRSYPVRTGDGGPLPLSGGTGTIYDYEAPYGAGVTYTADVTGATAATAELDIDDVWLIHPGVPARSVQIRITSLPEEDQPTASTLYQILGRQDPLPISSGARPLPSGPMGLRTTTDAQRRALKLLCSDDAVLLLNIPPSKPWGWDACYVSVRDLKAARTVAYGRFPYREWSLPIQVVERPGGGTQAAVTWASVAAQYPTWQSIIDAGITTWAELAAPTS